MDILIFALLYIWLCFFILRVCHENVVEVKVNLHIFVLVSKSLELCLCTVLHLNV